MLSVLLQPLLPLMALLYCHLQGRGMFFNKAKTLKFFERIFINERRLKI